MKYVGYICIVLVAATAAFIGYSYIEAKNYEAEVLELLPGLLTEISGYEQYSALGDYKSCPTKESNNVEIQVVDPVEAILELDCYFENGTAVVYAKLQRTNNEWEAVKLQVSSEIFAPAFNKASQSDR